MKKYESAGARVPAVWTVLACAFCMQASFAHEMGHDMGNGMGHAMSMQHGMASMQTAPQAAPPPFVASTAKPFDGLMDDAMNVMEYAMASAPMNGNADHDFVTMMIPHHQGAVDMAKAVLLYTTDPEMRNLAQGIVTEQQYEIQLMQLWLQRHPNTSLAPARPAR